MREDPGAMTPAGTFPDEAVALFHEAPEAFIAAREALVARLRDGGRTDDAKAVKSLRKPTVVAWALDQLAVRDPDGLGALLDAGAEVRAAQQAALSSKRGATDRLRTAGAARREAVARLAWVAIAALAEAGRDADAHADAIAQALETCSVDPDAGSALASGTLERPPPANAGFGDVFGLTPLEGGREPSAGDAESSAGDTRPRSGTARSTSAGARVDRAELQAQVARQRRDRDAARRRATKARGSADGFAHELDGMRRRIEVIERKHADAAAAAGHAELEATRTERALAEVIARLEGLAGGGD